MRILLNKLEFPKPLFQISKQLSVQDIVWKHIGIGWNNEWGIKHIRVIPAHLCQGWWYQIAGLCAHMWQNADACLVSK